MGRRRGEKIDYFVFGDETGVTLEWVDEHVENS
jgi:hypothetical protein